MVSICESIAVRVLAPNRIIYSNGTELHLITDEEEVLLPWQCPRKIHGIDSSRDRVLIWGERYFMLFHVTQEEHFSLDSEGKLSDWISCGKLLSGDEFCLVTAHSVAVRLRSSPGNGARIVEKSSCRDKSTLYCSQLLGVKWTDLVVFGGNAFGEIIIWQPNSTVDRAPVLRRFIAHQGVVFSINIHLIFGLLTTTSDDRSVRFWRLLIENEEINWADIKIECYRGSYGHSARVFQAKIIEEGNAPYVVSCGEDQCVCLWTSSGDLVGKIKRQMGSVLDCAFDSSTLTLFASTSSGNIFKHSINDMLSPISATEITPPLQDDYVSKVKFLSSTHIVGVSSKNKLFVSGITGKLHYEGKISASKITVLKVFGSDVFTGCYKVISMYRFSQAQELEKIFEESIMDSVIHSIFPFSPEEVLVSSESGLCKFTSDRFKTCTAFETPPCKERWITAALKINNFFVLSNRQGSLFLYLLNNGSCSLMSVIKHIHGTLGVTQMLFMKQIGEKFIFKTCGHDSTVKTVRFDGATCKLEVIHTENIPVAWIERMEGSKDFESSKTILGFNDNHFVIWEKSSDFLHQISCGGGHRCWDVKIDFEKNEFRYIYVKNKRLHSFHGKLKNVSRSKIKISANQWHVKNCNVLRAFPVNTSSSRWIFISGGEDNILKFSSYDPSKKKPYRVVSEIFLHISSIKAIEKVNTSPDIWLVFSAGGRAQICVSQVNLVDLSVEEKCNFMLKSSDFDRKYQRDRQDVDFDPETRIMALAVFMTSQGKLNTFRIFAGCSDGFIRLFSYVDASMKLIAQISYGKCILRTRLLCVHGINILITCATDGNICLWRAEQFSSSSLPFFKLKHHDSGINSLDIKAEGDLLYVATGGDDQRVVVSKIRFVDGNFRAEEKRNLDFLHTAQVNGVYITDCRRFLYTTGVDQKVCKVNLSNFELERSVFTCVADAKGLQICGSSENSNSCIIYGCGLQIFEL